MKKILFCLMLLAGFAASNTCTDLVVVVNNSELFSIFTFANVHRDSSYFLEDGNNAWSDKYFWSEGKLDSVRTDRMIEGLSSSVVHIYWNVDQTALTGKSSEIIITQKNSGDTIIYTQKNFYDGEFKNSFTYKKNDGHIYSLRHSPGSPDRGDNWTFYDNYLSNDTVYYKTIYDYYTENPRYDTQFIVGDPENDLKCYEYKMNENEATLLDTIELSYTENGFMFKYNRSAVFYTYFREHFFVYDEEGPTGIRKQRPAVKISPKARYFDLLGRYKFSK